MILHDPQGHETWDEHYLNDYTVSFGLQPTAHLRCSRCGMKSGQPGQDYISAWRDHLYSVGMGFMQEDVDPNVLADLGRHLLVLRRRVES